ncbi:hypothetical protein MCUN1_003692 [Malassezia cuniculi]|uniref:Uncharacterized protein n=1 Tax=Malassezia cuniculi TaxID=948313 RepID=A0AAF0F1R9_9BASI|nr:hypothetical protein MCUN1_003692 [Malassezia cuniculi]
MTQTQPQSLRKATAALYSLASLRSAPRIAVPELHQRVAHELRSAPNAGTHTPLAAFTNDTDSLAHASLADLELFLRSKRVHAELQERYNPTIGMTRAEHIRATARRVGLDVPKTK